MAHACRSTCRRTELREGLPIRVTFVRPEDSEPLPVGITWSLS